MAQRSQWSSGISPIMWHSSGERFRWRLELFHSTPKVEMAETDLIYSNVLLSLIWLYISHFIMFYIYFYFNISFYYYAFYCTFVFHFIIMLFNISIPFYCTFIFSFLLLRFLLLSFQSFTSFSLRTYLPINILHAINPLMRFVTLV